MKSTMLSLKTRDFIKSLVLFIGAPVLYELQKLLPGYNLPPLVMVGISAGITYLLKNLFTDDTKTAEKIVDENDKKIVAKSARVVPIILAMIMLSVSVNAQFFGRLDDLKNPEVSRKQGKNITFTPVVTTKDSIFFAFRPVVTAAFSLQKDMSKSSILVGTGVGWQHLKYTYPVQNSDGTITKGKYSYDFALSLLSFADVNSGSTGAALISPGLMFSVLNGQYGIGWRYNTGLNRGQVLATFTVNFNN